MLDDCWSDGRGKNDFLLPDPSKFPRGMGHVGDEIHKLNLKFGMYSSAGEMTCARYGKSHGVDFLNFFVYLQSNQLARSIMKQKMPRLLQAGAWTISSTTIAITWDDSELLKSAITDIMRCGKL